MTWDDHDLRNVLDEQRHGEFADLTVVKMARRDFEHALANPLLNEDAYEAAMVRLEVDQDKLRMAQTTSGKKLNAMVQDWIKQKRKV